MLGKYGFVGTLAASLSALLLASACAGSGDDSGGGGVNLGAPTTTIVQFSDFQAASVVLGQATFAGNQANRGGSVAADTLQDPAGNPIVSGGVLYVPDYGNNRVLAYSPIPTVNGTAANFAVGTSGLVDNTGGLTASLFNQPEALATSGTKFLLDDHGNSRILIFDSAPSAGGSSASVVVGQSDMTSGPAGCARNQLNAGEGFAAANGRLLVADTVNNRVLIWNSLPTTNGADADFVLGQADFTSCDFNAGGVTSPASMSTPYDVWSDGTRVIVADADNSRVLIWSTFPTTNQTSADVVLGQPDMTTVASGDPQNLIAPNSVFSDGTQLFVADCSANRILIWDRMPTANFTPADHVLGQSNFTHQSNDDDNQDDTADAQPSARTLACPWGVHFSGNFLITSEYTGNHRALIYEGVPTAVTQ